MTQAIIILPSFILIVLAAICKAMADTIVFHQGGVFKGRAFFDITRQGKMLPGTKYPLDAFHLANSVMIFCFIAAILFPGGVWWVQFIILGITFNLTFNLFWNHIFN